MKTDQMLSVAEVLELQPGTEDDATWVNPGFVARVESIKHTQIKSSGKPMHICTLVGTEGGGKSLSMTVFRPVCPFAEVDTIEVSGKGLRRTEFNGRDQVSLGRETEIHLVRGGAVKPPENSRPVDPVRPKPNAPAPARSPETPAPIRVNGQTIGMAIKGAVDILIHNASTKAIAGVSGAGPAQVDLPNLKRDVKIIAMQIIEASSEIENGDTGSELGF